MTLRKYGTALALVLLGFAGAGLARADSVTYTVTATTSTGDGTGSLDFQFNANGPGATDTAVISNFTSDTGSLGPVNTPPTTGDASGDLSTSVTLGDDQVTNEFNQTFTYGTTLSFTLTLTSNAGTPGAAFFFTMFDSGGNAISPAPGSNGVAAIEIDVDPVTGTQEPPLAGDGVMATPQEQATPEPASVVLLVLGGLGLAGGYRWRKHARLQGAVGAAG